MPTKKTETSKASDTAKKAAPKKTAKRKAPAVVEEPVVKEPDVAVEAVVEMELRRLAEYLIADENRFAVDARADAEPRQLLHGLYAGFVDMSLVRAQDGLRDRVVGMAFRQGEGLPGAIGHILATTAWQPRTAYTYYFGTAWSRNPRTDFQRLADWEAYLSRFAEHTRQPLKVNF